MAKEMEWIKGTDNKRRVTWTTNTVGIWYKIVEKANLNCFSLFRNGDRHRGSFDTLKDAQEEAVKLLHVVCRELKEYFNE